MLAAKSTSAASRKTLAKPAKSTKPATPRGTLSQGLILRTSLAIIDSDGLAGLTVRKLAEQLGVSAMAIYRHYKNKAEIESELVDLVVGDYDVTSHSEDDWKEWIYTTYANMRDALCAHPGVMPLLDNASYQGAKALAVADRILRELLDAGLTAEQAATLFHMLMANMIGSVVLMNEESRRAIVSRVADAEEQKRQRLLSFEMVPLGQFPSIAELAPHLAKLSDAQQFRASVMQIIKAVAG